MPNTDPVCHRHQFASDNTAGICPEAWAALAEANRDCVPSYGDDAYTQRAADLIRSVFETDCDVFFVFNGTSANSLSLASLCQSYHSVLCHELAHIERDECGAPEFFSNGTKLITLPGPLAKLEPATIDRAVTARNDLHFPKPRVLSLTQSTEFGTVYAAAELNELCAIAKRRGLSIHMDGARFANAVAALAERDRSTPADLTWRAGIDVLSFGGTKNGMALGEAVVFFNRSLAKEFEYRCKQAGQLASKMRFISSQWVVMLQNGAWLKHAQHANHLAQKLGSALEKLPGIRLAAPVEANAVFVHFPEGVVEKLHGKGWHFHGFLGGGGHRLMCSWATTEEDVAQFLEAVQNQVNR
jgi:threonine aldolase